MRNLQVMLLAMLGGCSGRPETHASTADAGRLLVDRNWIDRMPETRDDRLHVYRFVPSMGGGVFQDRTLYRGTFELFTFKVDEDHLDIYLPQTRERVRSQFTIEKVSGPTPFDLKLTLWSDPRGPKVYFSVSAETDRDGHLLEQRLRREKK
jgi:hypothetical protein